jgi:hypothetical protein
MRSTRPSCAAGGAYASGDDRPPAHSSRAQEACGTDVHFFVWVILILITVFIDIFRLHDLPGRTKALRFLFVLASAVGRAVPLLSPAKPGPAHRTS